MGLRKAWVQARRKRSGAAKGLRSVSVDPSGCHGSYDADDAALQKAFVPLPVVGRMRGAERRRLAPSGTADAPQPTPPQALQQPSSSPPTPTPPTVTPLSRAKGVASSGRQPVGAPCTVDAQCVGTDCKLLCCNPQGGASTGCVECDYEGDCTRCDQGTPLLSSCSHVLLTFGARHVS